MNWKPLIDINPMYDVSDTGEVRSNLRTVTPRPLSQKHTPYSYCMVNLRCSGKTKQFFVHRLVAMAFIPNPENKRIVNHKDSDPNNNRVENLEWVTHKENTRHAMGKGRINSGEDHPMAKLSNEAVEKIKSLLATNNYTLGYIAKEFGVTRTQISHIRRGARTPGGIVTGGLSYCSSAGRKRVSAPTLYDSSIVSEILAFLKSGHSQKEARAKFTVGSGLIQRIAVGKRLPTNPVEPIAEPNQIT